MAELTVRAGVASDTIADAIAGDVDALARIVATYHDDMSSLCRATIRAKAAASPEAARSIVPSASSEPAAVTLTICLEMRDEDGVSHIVRIS